MPRVELRVVRHREHVLPNTVKERLVISSRKIGPSDRAREDQIAHQSQPLCFGMQNHVAR